MARQRSVGSAPVSSVARSGRSSVGCSPFHFRRHQEA